MLTHSEISYSQCPVVAGALFWAQHQKDPTNAKYDLKDKLCPVPSQQMDVLSRSTHLCCASWLRASIGTLRHSPWREVWNSPVAQDIRKSIHDGSYRYCNNLLCPKIQGNQVPYKSTLAQTEPMFASIIAKQQVELDTGPQSINLSYDATCNLSCPSCRTEKIATDNATRDAYQEMQEKSIMPLLKEAKTVLITGSGDPFASKNFRDVLMRINDEDYPNLSVLLMTNGLLLTPNEWNKFKHLAGKISRISVSIDGASKESHEITRRGSNWEKRALSENS